MTEVIHTEAMNPEEKADVCLALTGIDLTIQSLETLATIISNKATARALEPGDVNKTLPEALALAEVVGDLNALQRQIIDIAHHIYHRFTGVETYDEDVLFDESALPAITALMKRDMEGKQS